MAATRRRRRPSGRRDDRDEAIRETRAHAQVETLIRTAQGGVQPAESRPRLTADEEPAHVGAEHVGSRGRAAPGRARGPRVRSSPVAVHAHHEGADDVAVVPVHELGGRDDEEAARAPAPARRTRAVGSGAVVLGQEPHRVAGQTGGRQRRGGGEGRAGGRRDDALRSRSGRQTGELGVGAAQHDGQGVDGTDLRREAASVRCRWFAAGVRPSGRTTRMACTRSGMTRISLSAPSCDRRRRAVGRRIGRNDRRAGVHANRGTARSPRVEARQEPQARRLSLRRSRSLRPPQMPNRSSF